MLRRLVRTYFYSNYRQIHRVQNWLRSRFSALGLIVFWSIPVCVAIALDTRSIVGYQALALMIIIFAMANILGAMSRLKLEATRRIPPYGVAGEPLRFEILARTNSKRRICGIGAKEEQSNIIPTKRQFLTIREPNESKRNWYDRFYGYYRWKWLIEHNRIIEGEPLGFANLEPDRDNRIELTLTPKRRGRLELNNVTLIEPDPFGIRYRLHRKKLPASLTILPKAYHIPKFSFPGLLANQRSDQTARRSRGKTDEFFGLREYHPGDPLRHIHWRSAAKEGKLVVREYVDDTSASVAIFVDSCVTSERFDLFESAISAAASIQRRLQRADGELDRLLIGSKVFPGVYGARGAELAKALEPLAFAQPDPITPFEAVADSVLRRLDGIESFIGILIGWDDSRKAFVEAVHATGLPNRFIVIRDPRHEDAPPHELPQSVCVIDGTALESELANLR